MADSINPTHDRKRKKREGVLILAILITVAALTFIETRITHFGNDFPLSSTVLMFILINTNLLMLLALLLLVFRNLAKLYYEKKKQYPGNKTQDTAHCSLYCSGPAAHNGSFLFFHPIHLHQYRLLV